MDYVQETLPELSQYFAGLLLASLVVFIVLLVGIIMFRRGRNSGQNSISSKQKSSAQGPSAEVVTLSGSEEDPAERANRFQILASTALEDGRLGEAKTLYEKTLSVSADHKIPEIMAHARYELGNLSKAQNELSAACEHWQVARNLYFDLGDKKKVRELDNIMTDSQCPPDWIMTKL